MSGFFKDGRPDDAPLTAEEQEEMQQAAVAFYELATLLARATKVGECREISKKVDELDEAIGR